MSRDAQALFAVAVLSTVWALFAVLMAWPPLAVVSTLGCGVAVGYASVWISDKHR